MERVCLRMKGGNPVEMDVLNEALLSMILENRKTTSLGLTLLEKLASELGMMCGLCQ